MVGCTDTFYAGQLLHLLSELFPIYFLQNRYVPIIGYSLHVYWRVNRSLDSPVRTRTPQYNTLTL